MSAVTQEQATVFRGGGRRYFTKRAAYVAAARECVRKVCECEPAEWDTGYPGMTCGYHTADEDYGERVVERLARLLQRWDKTAGANTDTPPEDDDGPG